MIAATVHGAGLYVAGAYGVFIALLAAYLGILLPRLVRVRRDVRVLESRAEAHDS